MKTFQNLIEEIEHRRCEFCGNETHPDHLHDFVSTYGVQQVCTNCKQQDSDVRHCATCERLHNPSHNSEHCPECERKDTRHEVRYYNNPHGGDVKHEYFKTLSKAHAFAKKNSYDYGNSEVYHKGQFKSSYWQGR